MKLDLEQLWTICERVRKEKPLVHNITNFVTMNNSANALLAIGASPAMVHSCDEVAEFVGISKALVVNIGTLYSEQIAAMKLACHSANDARVPWILDPVGVGATTYRSAAVRDLVSLNPTVIRGNASEILCLADFQKKSGKGVDSTASSDAAVDAAISLAKNSGTTTAGSQTTVAVTGVTDYVASGNSLASIDNGHALMSCVTGLGCSLSAVIGAFIAVEKDHFSATVAAISYFSLAGELAEKVSKGPGSLQLELLDQLFNMTKDVYIERAKVEMR